MATKNKLAHRAKDKDAVTTAVILASLQSQAAPLFNKLKKIEEVKTKKDLEFAGTQMKLLKEIGKEAKRQMDDITSGMYSSIAKVENLFIPFAVRIKEYNDKITILIKDFYDEQDRLEAKIEADFAAGKIKKVETYTSKISETQIAGSKDGASRRRLSKALVTDPSKVPDKYWILNIPMIEQDLKDGIKVPGAELTKINSIAI